MSEIVVLLSTGVLAGTLNSFGGSGKFVALPALVAHGLPPVTANAAATVALTPGAVAGAWVCRREIGPVGEAGVGALTGVSLLGGGLGAGLLLTLPSASFDAAVPWLLAFATVILACGRRISRLLTGSGTRPATLGRRSILAAQFLLALYGGYFGGAVGVLMMALWSAGLGMTAAAGNTARIAQLAAVYLAASALFLLASDVPDALAPLTAVLAGAVAGGYGGAHLARRLPDGLLRGTVLATAATMTVLYFLRA